MACSFRRRLEPAAALLISTLLGCGAVAPAPTGGTGTPGVQPGAVQPAPSTGYLWSAPGRTLRAIQGVPGASQLGPSLVPAGLYVAAAASPFSSSALLIDQAGSLSALQLPSGRPLRLGSGFPAAAAIRFAPSGGAAVVLAPGGQSLLEVSGLPAAPVSHTIAVPAGVAAAAPGDSGSVLTATGGTAGSAISVIKNGQTTILTSVGEFGGFAFLPGLDDAVIVDNAAKTLTLWHSVSSNPTHLVIAEPLIHNALAVNTSRDGRWALIANGGDSKLVRVDLSGMTVSAAVSCSCRPSTVEALAGAALFRVSDAQATAQTPVWTADASAAQPRLLFIPAAPTTAGAR